MSICTACATITPNTRQLTLHAEIAHLRASAQSCPLCHMVLEALSTADLITKAEQYRAHVGADGAWQLVNDTCITVSINGHFASAAEKAYALIVSCGPLRREDPVDPSKTYVASSTWLGIEAEEGDAAAEVIVTRPLAEDPRSEGPLRLMKSWIKTCVDQHENCQVGYTQEEMQLAGPHDAEGARLRAKYDEKDSGLPTRVIDVLGFEDGVRLVESQAVGGRGCYVALSHVWGKVAHYKTTKATYDTHLAKIPLIDLPKTFRDAVRVTRDLGIRYLWIDSLCIIQDSPSDWEHEASLMASVYMNAYVTISATSATDSNGGLFTPRQPPESSISLTYTSPLSGTTAGRWTIHNRTPSWDQHVRRSVLASRAWTLQEKQLARRTLHFAHDQVSFECKTHLEFETQRPSQKIGAHNFYFQTLYWTLVAFRGRHQPSLDLIVAGLVMRAWSRVVEDYSLRKLTFDKDKLPALEGLARYVSALTRDRYCFGLWRTQLDIGLLWRTAPYVDADARGGRVAGRAPSWSWASVDGRVYFALHGDKPLEEGHTTGSALEVVDVDSDGALTVRGGMLKLKRGKLGCCGQWDLDQWVKVYKRIASSGPNPLIYGYENVRSEDCSCFGFAAMDESWPEIGSEVDEPEVDALLVTRKTKNGSDIKAVESDPFKENCFVLFLDSAVGELTYRRIGMGQVFLCEEIGKVEKRQIRII